MEKLEALGFVCVVGQIDRDGINYGHLSHNGPVLTPEGEALVKSLTPAPKKARKVADAVEVADVYEEPADPVIQ